MSNLSIFQSAINALKAECFRLAEESGLFLQVDEAGNIWLGDDKQEECFRVCGWNMTYQQITKLIKEKEINSNAKS
jgi:hypothetical protein